MLDTLSLLEGLANANRLHLFLVLLKKDFCVCELQEILDLEQSRLSHQLCLLKSYGLVKSRQEGRWMTYYVPDEVKKNPIIQALAQNTELPVTLKEKIPRLRVREKMTTKEEIIKILQEDRRIKRERRRR